MCDICCESFNKLNHKRVDCSFCDLKSCRNCCQYYLLSVKEDPHCMKCKHEWNREFIDNFCTVKFRNTEYRIHRENVLFDIEKSLMPSTQPQVEKIILMKKIIEGINEKRDKLIKLYKKHRIFFNIHDASVRDRINEDYPDIYELRKSIDEDFALYSELKVNNSYNLSNASKFNRKCPVEECRGFLNDEWYCVICENTTCEHCNEMKTENHVCDKETVKTIKLLKRDSKPCPKCGTVIYKISGCSQMFCVDCHTAFDWYSGMIEIGRIHNPHYLEFKRLTGLNRENGDIPCGGIPTFGELRQVNAPESIMDYCILLRNLDLDMNYRYVYPYENNTNLRISYMMGYIDQVKFKKELQKRDKIRDKFGDVRNIYRMLIDTIGDFLRQYIIDKSKYTEILCSLEKIIDYANMCIAKIHKRYKCVTPYKIEKKY
jgi:hypothetical protein